MDMNITMTGNLGSGKTSVCKEFQKMGYEIISTGNIFREIAAEKNITVIELNELAKKDRSIDDMIDNRTVRLGRERDNVIFDSRLAWHFVPDSFKVFLLVDTNEAARRVFDGDARAAEEYSSRDEAAAALRKRAELEQARFKELYGINYYDLSNYNLVIESTSATPEELAREIIDNFREYGNNPYGTRLLLNSRKAGSGSPFDVNAAGSLDEEGRSAYMADFSSLS
jgi:cytidylate kinase